MRAHLSSLETIEKFFAQKRIAMVGISRDPKSFSATLFQEFSRRGYEVVPVNPNSKEMLGRRCFARLQDVQPPVQAALLMTPPAGSEAVVRDCANAGVKFVWLYRAAGQGAVSEEALRFCAQHSIEVIPGECPYMFWDDAGFLHGVHGLIRKITGRYPHAQA
jgi:uncharacterized protein